MSKVYERLQKCLASVREKTDFVPDLALVLGSGLGGLTEQMEIEKEIPYSEIEGFPVSTVAGHNGKFLLGTIAGVKCIVMSGRVHYYEGYTMEQVVTPTRIMGLMGAKKIILTNAAGGVNLNFKPGDLMMITDHISQFAPNPLLGENADELGPRFPDMSHVYDPELQNVIRRAAKNTGADIQEGVYLMLTGPSYETPAEIRMIRTLGGDAAGMSTVPEAIAANHMGMKVCGISCITNMAAGILDQPLSHKEVQETADRVKDKFEKLVLEIIRTM
ncbi:MAG: purine-nucleoside phosphorylase [Eubacterium sp.]|nr:purine-nucleoside phosphorylase [Eubacterium sp.]